MEFPPDPKKQQRLAVEEQEATQALEQYEQMWLDLVQAQSKLYRPYGIQVTLSGGQKNYERMGLHFELVRDRECTDATTCADADSSLGSTDSSDSSEEEEDQEFSDSVMADSVELYMLDSLRMSGLLPSHDYKLAKEMLRADQCGKGCQRKLK
jgi:hypothetical protein